MHTAPGCLVPVESVSALIQRQEMMLPRRNHGSRTPMLEKGEEEEKTAKAAEEAVRLPWIPRSKHMHVGCMWPGYVSV